MHLVVELCGLVVDAAPWVSVRSVFVATSAFTCVSNVALASTNFLFVAMSSVTMFRSAVAANVRFYSAVAIPVVSYALFEVLNPVSPDTRCCSRIS